MVTLRSHTRLQNSQLPSASPPAPLYPLPPTRSRRQHGRTGHSEQLATLSHNEEQTLLVEVRGTADMEGDMATAGSDLQDIEAVEPHGTVSQEIEDQYINFYEGNSLAITESLAASPPTDLNPNNEQNSDETISASSLHTNAHTNATIELAQQALSNTVHDERRVATQTQAEINTIIGSSLDLNGQMQLDLHEPVLPLWLSQSLHQQAQARLSQTQQIVVSEPSSLALNVIPPPSIEHLLQQEFPDIWSEAIALRQAQLKSLNGYIAFRNFHMLYTISKALGFDLFTNYSDGVVKSLEGQDITISHIYSWLGINHRTFANKRAKLHHVYQSLQLLQHIMDRGLASPRLMELHSQWYMYQLSCTQLLSLEEQQLTQSVHWRIIELYSHHQTLVHNLDAVVSL